MPTIIIHKLCIDQPQVYRTINCIDTASQMFWSLVLGENITRKTSRFFVSTPPPLSFIPPCVSDDYHIMAQDMISQALPLHFAVLYTIKNWTVVKAWELGYIFMLCDFEMCSSWFYCCTLCCVQCAHVFCWLCLDPWSVHNHKTGGYFK